MGAELSVFLTLLATFKHLTLMTRYGLRSCFIFKCKMCNVELPVNTEKDSQEMDVNRGAVCVTMCTGGGQAQLEEMTSAMNIPTMSAKTFRKYHDDV
ncbi:hypothetical protein PR048_008263 [Dryococelus australis]|uniref:Mutator-like transposase domain-containing protein n=1 Tax=Dryococelus australis TaxID=614101 RepID=A0ABQ9HXE9_9NEOP|nr:hypothetical protein PR048_008263 [Dryococelus australis]